MIAVMKRSERPKPSRDDKPISAQVILRSASGRSPGPASAVTAANVADYAPSPDAARRVSHALEAFGFSVGPMVGNSFSITGPPELFERYFRAKVAKRAGRRLPEDLEIPLGALPKDIAGDVAAVTFSPPPDFGPGSFG